MTNRLLEAYNDYIEYEFNERRNSVLDIKLGLMYSTDEDGNEIELYYDTIDKVFYGIKNEEIVYEQKADFEEATQIIDCNGFDDYYNVVTEGGKLCY